MPRLHRVWLPSVVAVAALALSACSAPGPEPSQPTGVAQAVTIDAIQPVSGAFAVFGADIINGIKLAEETIAASEKFSSIDLTVKIKDDNSTPATSAALVAEAAASDTIAVIGPPGSANALAAVPIAQNASLPYMAVLSLVNGVVETGDHIYRMSTPAAQLTSLTLDEIEKRGAERVAYIYNLENPTLTELAEDVIPADLEERGIEVVAAVGTPTATSYTQLVAQLLENDPDMVGILHVGAANPEILSELREQGYDGEIFTHGSAAGLFDAIPDIAEGLFYATDFNVDLPFDETQAFVEAYEDKFGSAPSTYAAVGFDALMFLATAIVNANEIDRPAVLESMQALAKSGEFAGAVGPVQFGGEGNRAAKVGGVLVELVGGKETVLVVGSD